MANLDRYGGAEAYARHDVERSAERDDQLRSGACGRCAHAFADTVECESCDGQTRICVCLLDPSDPWLTAADESPADIGCEDYEEGQA